ncbi:MerR family transcriptional regulator [Actinomycetes bacterium M1A6_2h]
MAELITIGALARACGLTTSALRFYDDCGLLVPTEVDPTTGYRFYEASQVTRASTIRKLREIDVPLAVVTSILDGDRASGERLLDAHVDALRRKAATAARVVGSLKIGTVVVPGPLFATAVEQVCAAAAVDGDIRVLNGVLVEVDESSITLTCSDRYRLATRSLPVESESTWSCVVEADSLRLASRAARTRSQLHLRDGFFVDDVRCVTIDETFPDVDTMMRGLGPVHTRTVIDRAELVARVEGSERFSTAGLGVDMTFDSSRLLASLHSAVGTDVMLDFLGPRLPLVVRSADDGDLTMLVMPVEAA